MRTNPPHTRGVLAALVVLAAGAAAVSCANERPGQASRVRGGGPAPEAAARARLVAEAWDGSRAAEQWRAGYYPMGEEVQLPGDAFHDEAGKEAYGARNLALRGELPALKVAEGTVRWENGGSLTLPLMDAREAYADLDRGDGPQPLTVTRVRLGEMTMATSRGPATVPAWLFTLDGYDTPLKRAALSPSELPEPPVEPAGDTPAGDLGELLGLAGIAEDGRSVTVRAGHGACDDGPAVHALETDGTVVLSGSVVGGPDGEPCTAQLLAEDVTVRLDRPLGGRVLLDAFTGRPLPYGEGHGTSPEWG
ncbi:hypothetical protein [Streptomyces sp. JB150]|uniref:hypothetical protein n=1 Tax=Streptomyces sp. JB150 TaxID=2714844 RepID=UPI00140D50B0|nr:hypothetical protein [Streptomyces sp. JB150]QIJ61040.1 hypothetical protein G7Z13_02580 [Streptomyces sp. JB150]